MTITSTLQQVSTKDLQRALNSTKQFLYFDVSVFNTGAVIRIKCTDTFKIPSARTWNGYDFLIENDHITNYYIEQELASRQNS